MILCTKNPTVGAVALALSTLLKDVEGDGKLPVHMLVQS